MMLDLRQFCACCVIFLATAGSVWPATASEQGFPFGRELMLDVAPMRGSKRVPILEIEQDGAASLDLWCNSVRGKANVGDDSITIVPDTAPPAQCAPERQSNDENLLSALSQVTNWRRSGEVIELTGATTLRFRLMTN
jgi:heat shock protein HslJ